jgi:agmatinase
MDRLTENFLQGHGLEGRFGGLPDAFALLDTSAIVVLPVPFDQTTTYVQGTDLGPAALIEASRYLELYDIETDSEVFLRGIYTAPAIEAKTSTEMLDATYKRTLQYLKQGKFVATLGGEHSISAAPIRAHAEHFGKISVLQFDAHADLASAYRGDPLSHASVMARVREMEQVERSVAVGIRSMSSEEKDALERENTLFAHEIHGDENWIEKMIERLTDPVYITFDLDVFDSSLMPSTGTPEPGGLFWHQVAKALKEVSKRRKIIGFDIVELCPSPHFSAPDFLAAKLLYKMLSFVFEGEGSK